MIEHPLFKLLEKLGNAIGCLREHNHYEAALVLIYAAIDHMAWLADENNDGERVGHAGFEAWVRKYVLKENRSLLLGATSKDLWGARCGILHTGAPENDAYRKSEARQIYYYSGVKPVTQSPVIDSEVLYLSLEELTEAFVRGVHCFMTDLKTSPERDSLVCGKLARTLTFKNF